MPLLKFQTIGRNNHRFGRVSLLMEVDRKMKKLFVTLEQAKSLNGGYTGKDIRPEFVHFRLQLLPSQNVVAVTQVSQGSLCCCWRPTCFLSVHYAR